MSYLSVVLADGPGMLWPLNETSGTTAADLSNNGNTGTYTGGYTLSDTAGPVQGTGGAVLLNGTTGYVQSSYNPSVTAISLECWFNLSGLTQSGNLTFIGNDEPDGGSNKGIYLYSQGVGTVMLIVVGNGTTFQYSYGGSTPAAGWHHLVGTYNGSNFYLYFDTVQIGSGSLAGPYAVGAHKFAAGYNPTLSGQYVHGLMAWTAIYPSALTQAQVVNHYNAAIPGFLPQALPNFPVSIVTSSGWRNAGHSR